MGTVTNMVDNVTADFIQAVEAQMSNEQDLVAAMVLRQYRTRAIKAAHAAHAAHTSATAA